ncbi:acetyltransferase [Parafrankia colletiae]|uniref:Acetyltransferase n=1 Tax=Parafrankia colletiae TaxID=573497 RepID=A0A1S1RIH4_9ACTN|nr:acetyltransferase [Parafrankia colletiae]
MKIRECREQDLELLETCKPSPGRTRRHAIRFDRQQRGLSTYLTAWVDGLPAGTGEILWSGCAAPEVHQIYSRCPELNGLDVWPAERQSQGIGTAVIRAAEARTYDRGYHQIGLGVTDDNPRAAALYLRLGYQETGCLYLDRYYYLDDHGHRHDVADPARFLVKQLQARQLEPGNPPPPAL